MHTRTQEGEIPICCLLTPGINSSVADQGSRWKHDQRPCRASDLLLRTQSAAIAKDEEGSSELVCVGGTIRDSSNPRGCFVSAGSDDDPGYGSLPVRYGILANPNPDLS